jgi:hypothetical protein
VPRRRLLPLLHPLLLRGVFLLQLLSRLLVPLFAPLSPGLVGVLLLQPLMILFLFLFLFLLELLTLLLLAGEHLVLLLLVILIAVGVPGIGRSRTFKRRKFFGMDRGLGQVVFAAGRIATMIDRRVIRRSAFAGGHDGAAKVSWPPRRGDGRTSVIGGGMQFPVAAGSLLVLNLRTRRICRSCSACSSSGRVRA